MSQEPNNPITTTEAIGDERRPLWFWLALTAGVALLLFTVIGAGRTVASGGSATQQLMAIEVDADDRPVAEVVEAASESPAAEQVAPEPETMLTFDGRPIRKAREIEMLVTAYSPDEKSCGIWADGITASGYSVWTNGMKLVAADTDLLPFGSILTIPGYDEGLPVPVLDRGGKIKGNRLDVLYPTHEVARQWGAQKLTVTVWEYAD